MIRRTETCIVVMGQGALGVRALKVVLAAELGRARRIDFPSPTALAALGV